jgi:hypothetical protein
VLHRFAIAWIVAGIGFARFAAIVAGIAIAGTWGVGALRVAARGSDPTTAAVALALALSPALAGSRDRRIGRPGVRWKLDATR